jgi:hypothetical protein
MACNWHALDEIEAHPAHAEESPTWYAKLVSCCPTICGHQKS